MKIYEVDNLREESASRQVLEILTRCGKEFVPPLCARNSALQSDFAKAPEAGEGVPYAYFEGIKKQCAFVAEEDGVIAGFMSFRKDFLSETVTEEYLPDIYISTVITDKKFRRQGITKGFYEKMSTEYGDRNIFTRTWSSNLSHTSLLKAYGFDEYKRIKNDRGEGIDTVYYLKRARQGAVSEE